MASKKKTFPNLLTSIPKSVCRVSRVSHDFEEFQGSFNALNLKLEDIASDIFKIKKLPNLIYFYRGTQKLDKHASDTNYWIH